MSAPQVIAKLFLNIEEKEKYLKKIENLANNGLRVVSLGIIKNGIFQLVG